MKRRKSRKELLVEIGKILPGKKVRHRPWVEKWVSLLEENTRDGKLVSSPVDYEARLKLLDFLISRGRCVDFENCRKLITHFVPKPIVYYYGIGNITHETRSIDIASALLATDFRLLIATDIMPDEESLHDLYDEFERSVKANLSLTDEVDLARIKFKKINETTFEARFGYDGKRRRVLVFCNFDAKVSYPDILRKGYHVLYTKDGGRLFAWFQPHIQQELLDYLEEGKGFFVTEEKPFIWAQEDGFVLSEEFLQIDLQKHTKTKLTFGDALGRLLVFMKLQR